MNVPAYVDCVDRWEPFGEFIFPEDIELPEVVLYNGNYFVLGEDGCSYYMGRMIPLSEKDFKSCN